MLEMRGITKRFPGVLANDHVDFDVRAGEVHTLFGENGAGKSTLMRVLYGLYRPDEGEIRINGEPVVITSPAAAIRHGIGMIHQHFMLVPTLTVAENVALGLKSTRGLLTDLDRVTARIDELSTAYGLQVDPRRLRLAAVGRRAPAGRDHEGALPRGSPPGARRADRCAHPAERLTTCSRCSGRWRPTGAGLIFISHKIREVLALSDRITVLRGGRKIGNGPRRRTSPRSSWPT